MDNLSEKLTGNKYTYEYRQEYIQGYTDASEGLEKKSASKAYIQGYNGEEPCRFHYLKDNANKPTRYPQGKGNVMVSWRTRIEVRDSYTKQADRRGITLIDWLEESLYDALDEDLKIDIAPPTRREN